ncbi:hypothetical protein ILYODFUR_014212 [Ilyodon furcidens]|uniref:Uncharacterized protein n=1 Tax=Ilyodon furcidens TaxID=33524 RepID=A0ABV0UUV6_9TELE
MTLPLHLLYHPEDDGGHLDDWHSCWLSTCFANQCNRDRTPPPAQSCKTPPGFLLHTLDFIRRGFSYV